jgi:protein-disulfide isomerase
VPNLDIILSMMTEEAIASMQAHHKRKRTLIRLGIFLAVLIAIPLVYFGYHIIFFYSKIKSGELTSYDQVRISRSLASRASATGTISAADFAALVPTSTVPELGNQNAALTIVEFADYQCPYCKEMIGPIRHVMNEYKDRIHFVVRDFPVVDLHSDARNAALAARCVLDQGQTAYWRYQELLYADQDHLSPDDLRAKANLAKINVARFDECIKKREYDLMIDQDIELAKRIGVEGTPTFFLNGVKVEGSMDESHFQLLIQEALSQLGE